MARISNAKKLHNQVEKNRGFKDLVGSILDNSIVIKNVSNIIEDNPGYLDWVLDFIGDNDYEIDETDLEVLCGATVRALGKTKIMHNNDTDFASLLDNFSKESGEDETMSIAGDVFQLIKVSLPDMTDSDAGSCALYICMSLALREAFPEGVSVTRNADTQESEEPVDTENDSDLSRLDLRKYLNKSSESEPETTELVVAASESTSNEPLGDEVVFGNGHKARKVKKPKTKIEVAASESTAGEQTQPETVTAEVVDDEPLTKDTVTNMLNAIFDGACKEFNLNSPALVKSFIGFDAIVDEIAKATETNKEITEDEISKIILTHVDRLKDPGVIDALKKLVSSSIITSSTSSAPNPETTTAVTVVDMMKGIKADDPEINNKLSNAPIKFMRNCMAKEVLDALDGDLSDLHDLVTAARSGKKTIFYHTLANICEGNQVKADKVIAACRTAEINSIMQVLHYTPAISLSKNIKLATC